MFNNTKLDRVRKRQSAGPSNEPEVYQKQRRTSCDVQACILCEKIEPASDIRRAETMHLNQTLRECAQTLNDGKLLVKLGGGEDAVALEFKYHLGCLNTLYNIASL